jgi:hypothetical protein
MDVVPIEPSGNLIQAFDCFGKIEPEHERMQLVQREKSESISGGHQDERLSGPKVSKNF